MLETSPDLPQKFSAIYGNFQEIIGGVRRIFGLWGTRVSSVGPPAGLDTIRLLSLTTVKFSDFVFANTAPDNSVFLISISSHFS